jgi:hypothetical protein
VKHLLPLDNIICHLATTELDRLEQICVSVYLSEANLHKEFKGNVKKVDAVYYAQA